MQRAHLNELTAASPSMRSIMNPGLPVPTHSVVRRQEAIAPPPPTSTFDPTSIVTLTSRKTIISSRTGTSNTQTLSPSSGTSLPSSTTAPTPPPSTSETSSSIPSRTDLVSTQSSLSITSPTSTTALTTATSIAEPPTSTSSAFPSRSEGARIGLISGIVVGSVFGAILLGLFIYWLHACYRGVNVCNCFGGRSERDVEDQQSMALPHPAILYPASGIGAAPRLDNGLRPPFLTRNVVEHRPSARLQRKPVPTSGHPALDTITECGI